VPVFDVSAIEQPSDREVVISRVFDAPPELLWKAWSDPKHLHRWYGPAGYTTTTQEFAFVTGGTWRFVMHGPDGTDTPNTVVFRELTPPSRLVYENSWERPGLRLDFTIAVTFVAEGGGTRMSFHFTFADAEGLRIATEEYGVREGGAQTLERFGEFLHSSST
jgi:uncharacterized protein YndB with AHSA1/START domain